MKKILIVLLIFYFKSLFSQNDSIKKLTISGYGELYYSYDFSNPQNHEKPNFLYNHKRHNEINFNLIVIKSNYSENNFRANLDLMLGNYAQYNLSAETNWAQFIYNANIGIKLSKKNNLWLDAGVLPSHIGAESAISDDCWSLTRSLSAENSPYYETGIKLNYTSKNEKLNLAFLVLNGWQRIKKPDHIQNPSIGLQLNYKSSEKLTFNYSNFLGTDKPDSINAFRVFHNFFIQYEPTKKIGLIANFDIGNDKYDLKNYSNWYTPGLIIKYNLNDNIKIACRGEYYYDKHQIIITTNTLNGFQVFGFSSNLDYSINKKVKFRVEAKMYQSKDNIFQENTQNKNYSITTNLTFKI